MAQSVKIEELSYSHQLVPLGFDGALVTVLLDEHGAPCQYITSMGATVLVCYEAQAFMRRYDLANKAGCTPYIEKIIQRWKDENNGSVRHYVYCHKVMSTLADGYKEAVRQRTIYQRKPRNSSQYRLGGEFDHFDPTASPGSQHTASSDPVTGLLADLGIDEGSGDQTVLVTGAPDVVEEDFKHVPPHRRKNLRRRPPEEYVKSLT